MTPGWISAIVPTVGRPESLGLLLKSLAAQTRRPDEVFVADGSDGEDVRRVAERSGWASSGLNVRHILVHPPNAVRQRVAAIAESRGEYLLLLDDDVVLESDCVERMAEALMRDTGVVGAFADFSNQSWPMPTAAWRLYLRYVLGMEEGSWQGRVVGPLLRFGYDPVPAAQMPIAWLGAGNSMVRRAAYDRSGGFSSFFLHRCTINEDVDLGLRLARLGTISFCPSARMGHFQAPGGRASVAMAAEDDLYNRYLVMRRTQGRSLVAAFGMVFVYFAIETASNLAGALLRLHGNGFGARLSGRLWAFGRILASPFTRATPQ